MKKLHNIVDRRVLKERIVHNNEPRTTVSFYKYHLIANPQFFRDFLFLQWESLGVLGRTYIATEGINAQISVPTAHFESFRENLFSITFLDGVRLNTAVEDNSKSFYKLIIKLRNKIVADGIDDPSFNPSNTGVHLSADAFNTLTSQPDTILIDMRNHYESEVGHFKNAILPDSDTFREEIEMVEGMLKGKEDKNIVMYCTGGIRCEKAAPYLIQQGFSQVFQLEGGILKYFEECGSDHFQGECFVFDKRVGLASDLGESGHGLCYVCQSLLTIADTTDPRTVAGVSCPRCYKSPETLRALSIEAHHARLKQATNPLPGRLPQDNLRPLSIDERHDGWILGDFLADVFPHLPQPYWQGRFASGEILDAHCLPVAASQQVRSGERYCTRESHQVEPDVSVDIQILHEDTALIVINKPAPLPMHPSGRYRRNTLQSILQQVYAPQKPRPAHRLDANTSGVVVFTRTARFARVLQPQFERGEVCKRYLARVVGHPFPNEFSCHAPLSAAAGRTGSRSIDPVAGSASSTDFQVLERSADGTSLLIATPKTGRTNQIRVHLWHLGWPIVGDATYLADQKLGQMQTLAVEDAPLCLHAWQLTFRHPQHDQPIGFEATAPLWARTVLRDGNYPEAVGSAIITAQ